jgi:hypothetical protein
MAMNLNRRLASDPIGMWQPDVILPSQYRAPRRIQAPEQRLMIAVLQDAIDCVEKYRFTRDYRGRGRRLFDEAMRWLLAEETDWPYSFECICGVLDLDANAVRYSLKLAPDRQPVSASRALQIATHGPQYRGKD